MGLIAIEGMEFFAPIGHYKEEQIIGTRFLVDFFFETETTTAEKNDSLEGTVNYAAVYAVIKEEMLQKANLLEHVARRILSRLQADFPQIETGWVKVSKLNPAMGGKIQKVSVTLSMEDQYDE